METNETKGDTLDSYDFDAKTLIECIPDVNFADIENQVFELYFLGHGELSMIAQFLGCAGSCSLLQLSTKVRKATMHAILTNLDS